MELNEVFRRVVVRHRRLIAFCVVVGVAVPVALALTADPTYTASTRLVVDSGDPSDADASAAIADGAKAVVTSPDHVRNAFDEAGYDGGDPAVYGQEHVNVRALGTSNVLEIAVTDDDPVSASAMANALANDLIRTRVRSGSRASELLAKLNGKVRAYDQRIDTLLAESNGLTDQIAAARAVGNVDEANRLEAEQSRVDGLRDEFISIKLDFESTIRDVEVSQALQPQARVIDPAAPPPVADSNQAVTDGALGGLLGLLVGLGIAATREMLHPTVAGGDAIARAFGTRPLGKVRRVRGRWAPLKQDDPVVVRLRLAAQSAAAQTVEVVAVPGGLDPAAFAYRLQEAIPGAARRGQVQGGLVVRAFGAEGSADTSAHPVALVLSERAVSLRDVESIRDLLALAERPVIGVIVAEGRRRRGKVEDDPTPRTKVIELPRSEVVERTWSSEAGGASMEAGATFEKAPAASARSEERFEKAPPTSAQPEATFEKAPAATTARGHGRSTSKSRGARKRSARRAANSTNTKARGTAAQVTPSPIEANGNAHEMPASTTEGTTEPGTATSSGVASTTATRAAAAVGGRASAPVANVAAAPDGAASANGKAASDAGDSAEGSSAATDGRPAEEREA
jgi:capsular polysaccharide biosynthesis protein